MALFELIENTLIPMHLCNRFEDWGFEEMIFYINNSPVKVRFTSLAARDNCYKMLLEKYVNKLEYK